MRTIDTLLNIIITLDGKPACVEAAELPELGHEYEPTMKFRRIRFDVLADTNDVPQQDILFACEIQDIHPYGIRWFYGKAFVSKIIQSWIDTRLQYEMIVESGKYTYNEPAEVTACQSD